MSAAWLLMKRIVYTVAFGASTLAAAFAVRSAYRSYRGSAAQFTERVAPVPPEDADRIAGGLIDVTLTVPPDVTAKASYLRSRNGAAIILAHGVMTNRFQLWGEARALARAGYGVLMLDMPGQGASTGNATWGKTSRATIEAALDFLASRPEVTRGKLGAYGFSMGSGVIAGVAATDPRIAAVALGGIFTTQLEQFDCDFGSRGILTRAPAIWAAKRLGVELDLLRPIDDVPKIAPRPVIFFAGDVDRSVPLWMTREVYRLAGDPKELVVIPGGGHGDYGTAIGHRFDDQLVGFFDRSLHPDAVGIGPVPMPR